MGWRQRDPLTPNTRDSKKGRQLAATASFEPTTTKDSTDALPIKPVGRGAQADADLPLAQRLTWRKTARRWKLYAGNRCFGEVIGDSNTELPQCTGESGMWRVALSGGRVSDYANLTWARSAVVEAAIREIEWDSRDPQNTRGLGGLFASKSSVVRSGGSGGENDSPPSPQRGAMTALSFAMTKRGGRWLTRRRSRIEPFGAALDQLAEAQRMTDAKKHAGNSPLPRSLADAGRQLSQLVRG